MSNILEQIKKDVQDNKIMLYMKGTPEAPQCGFSARVSEILKNHKVPFGHRNVLADPNLRQGIKEFSNWPTLPQLYINGEFVGGCDIVTELEQKGELEKLLEGIA